MSEDCSPSMTFEEARAFNDGFKRGEQAGLAYQAEAVRELRAALKQVRTVVRPWIDGGATFHEWRVAVDSIDAALARYPEEPGQGGTTP